MKYIILITIFLVSCKKDEDFSISVKSTGKSDFSIYTYYDYEDLKNNGSYKFKYGETLRPYDETSDRYISSEYAYKIECKGGDSVQYFVYKNRNLIRVFNGDFTLNIDKSKIK